MGKKTLCHPVSLHVVRGAAEYCGFRIGRLKQISSDPVGFSAKYSAEIVDMPVDCKDRGLRYILGRLNECFANDIHVNDLTVGTSRKMTATIVTRIITDARQDALPFAEEEYLGLGGGGGGGGGGLRDLPMLKQLKEIVARNNWVVLDTETTGLKRPCEIIDISIVDCSGVVLLDRLLQPKMAISPFIEDLTGITNDMVSGQISWPDLRHEVLNIIEGRDVLVYNATFDRHMMHCTDDMWGLPKREYKSDVTNWFCVMETYAEYFGAWNEYYGSYRWQKLTDAMDQQKLLVLDAHRANADATMTMWLIDHMCQL